MIEQLPVIIIDDDELQLQLVERAMKRFHNLSVSAFNNGADGLKRIDELADAEQSAIILLDLQMPDVAGFDILRKISDNDKYAGIHIIILSTSDEPADIGLARQLGFSNYLVKPTRHDVLFKKIQEIQTRYDKKLD